MVTQLTSVQMNALRMEGESLPDRDIEVQTFSFDSLSSANDTTRNEVIGEIMDELQVRFVQWFMQCYCYSS